MSTPEYERLMELEKFIADAYAYIEWAASHGKTGHEVTMTLAHDIGGLHRKERCFLPAVNGYAKKGRK